MQLPYFKEQGLDLFPFFRGTLNVSISPYIFTMKNPEFTFRQLQWTDKHPPEDFSFSRCQIVFDGKTYQGWVYYPHPETKKMHFQDPSIIEIIASHIPNLGYGDRVNLMLNVNEIEVSQGINLNNAYDKIGIRSKSVGRASFSNFRL